MEHGILGVQFLSTLVTEMSRPDVHMLGLTRHRQIMGSFREKCLRDVFTTSVTLLQKTVSAGQGMTPEQHLSFLKALLQLNRACLNFDFYGSSVDDSVDDQRTVQVPSEWREIIINPATLQLFFNVYVNFGPPASSEALACLVLLASVRRTLFQSQQRLEYIGRLLYFINEIFRTSHGLNDPENYHQFCRLLARVQTNFQLSDLLKTDHYNDCVQSVAGFTIQSLQHWQWAANSIHYLLALWERIITAMTYVHADKPLFIEKYCPQVTEAYIQSRISSVEVIIRDNLENPLDNLDEVLLQMKQFSVISRCDFEKSSSRLIQLFDPVCMSLEQVLAQGTPEPMVFRVLEGQLTWLTLMISAIIGGRRVNSPHEVYDTYDAELISRVLKVMNLLDARLNQGQCDSENMEFAILNFLHNYRVCFIGETTVGRYSRLYAQLAINTGLADEADVTNVIVSKIVTNLKCWCNSEVVIKKSLQLLSDICQGYTTLRRLIKSEVVLFMLANHSEEHFPFLAQVKDTRHRTDFYGSLGRIVASDVTNDNTVVLETFLEAFTHTLSWLTNAVAMNLSPMEQQQARRLIIGIARDLRGILGAVVSKPGFAMLFDWMFPNLLQVQIALSLLLVVAACCLMLLPCWQ